MSAPTVLKQDGARYGPRVLSARAAAQARAMLREVVTDGTASFGEVPGYAVAGKTGTADKPKPQRRLLQGQGHHHLRRHLPGAAIRNTC